MPGAQPARRHRRPVTGPSAWRCSRSPAGSPPAYWRAGEVRRFRTRTGAVGRDVICERAVEIEDVAARRSSPPRSRRSAGIADYCCRNWPPPTLAMSASDRRLHAGPQVTGHAGVWVSSTGGCRDCALSRQASRQAVRRPARLLGLAVQRPAERGEQSERWTGRAAVADLGHPARVTGVVVPTGPACSSASCAVPSQRLVVDGEVPVASPEPAGARTHHRPPRPSRSSSSSATRNCRPACWILPSSTPSRSAARNLPGPQ